MTARGGRAARRFFVASFGRGGATGRGGRIRTRLPTNNADDTTKNKKKVFALQLRRCSMDRHHPGASGIERRRRAPRRPPEEARSARARSGGASAGLLLAQSCAPLPAACCALRV